MISNVRVLHISASSGTSAAILTVLNVSICTQASSPTPIFGSSSTFGAASGFGGFKGVAAEPAKLSGAPGAAPAITAHIAYGCVP